MSYLQSSNNLWSNWSFQQQHLPIYVLPTTIPTVSSTMGQNSQKMFRSERHYYFEGLEVFEKSSEWTKFGKEWRTNLSRNKWHRAGLRKGNLINDPLQLGLQNITSLLTLSVPSFPATSIYFFFKYICNNFWKKMREEINVTCHAMKQMIRACFCCYGMA